MSFEAFIKFRSLEDQKSYFAPIAGKGAQPQPGRPGDVLVGYLSIDDILARNNGVGVTIDKVCVILLIISRTI